MMIQVFSNEDKEKLQSKGLKFICEKNIGDKVVYIFEYKNKLNFDISDVKYNLTNRLHF